MSDSNIEFVFGREGEKQIERDSYCRNVKLVYMSTCTPNTHSDFLALIRVFPLCEYTREYSVCSVHSSAS